MNIEKPKCTAARFWGLPCMNSEKPKCMAARFSVGVPWMKF